VSSLFLEDSVDLILTPECKGNWGPLAFAIGVAANLPLLANFDPSLFQAIFIPHLSFVLACKGPRYLNAYPFTCEHMKGVLTQPSLG